MASSPISSGASSSRVRPTTSRSAAGARNGVEPRPSRPMPHRATLSAPSSWTATVAPAIAKSPWRRANSRKPNPLRRPHTGKPTAVRTSPGASDGLPQAGEEVGRGYPAGGRRRRGFDLGVQRQRDGRELAGGVAVGDRAAQRAAVADLEVADVGGDAGQQGHRARHVGVLADHRVGGGGLDPDGVAAHVDALEFVDLGDVDEVLEMGQPQGQQRGQALPAGQDLAVLAVVRERFGGFVDGVGPVVGERRGLHEVPVPSTRMLCTRSV